MLSIKIVNIALFLVYLYGFGYTFCRSGNKNQIELHVMRLGIGLAVFPYAYILIRYSEKDNFGGEIGYNNKVQQFKKSPLFSLSFTNPSNDSYIFKIN